MKTLSPSQTAAAAGAGHALARFLSIAWPRSGLCHYSERDTPRDFSPDPSVAFEPIVAEFPDVTRVATLGVLDRAPFDEARFVLACDPASAVPLEGRIADEDPTGCVVTAYQVLKPLQGVATRAEWIRLGRYRIESVALSESRAGRTATFQCVDTMQQSGDRTIGRLIAEREYPSAPTGSYGLLVPRIFGTVEGAPCPLVTLGRTTTLDGDLAPSDGIVYVTGGIGSWPVPGALDVEGERIAYTTLDAQSQTLGSSDRPLRRGIGGTTPAGHTAGATVREMLAQYRFLVADHAVRSIANVRANGTPLAAAAWSAGTAAGRAHIDLLELPLLTTTSPDAPRLRLQDANPPLTWNVAPDNTAADAPLAVDTGDARETTWAALAAGQALSLQVATNLAGQAGAVRRAWLRVQYQTAKGGGIPAWPADPPRAVLLWGGAPVAQVPLAEPPAMGAASLRVEQMLDVTALAVDGGGWAWFGPSLTVRIEFPAQASSTTLRVTDLSFEADVRVVVVRQVAPEDVSLTADVAGIAGSDGTITGLDAIEFLLTDPDHYGLFESEFDRASLESAIADATNSGAIHWRFDRRLVRPETLRSLLSSAVADAGIRSCIEGGVLRFFPRLGASAAEAVAGLSPDDAIVGTPVECAQSSVELVVNQLAVYYARSFAESETFTRVCEVEDRTSQDVAWGVRRDTEDLEWVRDGAVAQAFAMRALADFSQRRRTWRVVTYAPRTLALEVGDVVTLHDPLAGFDGQAGRIVGASFPEADGSAHRLTVAVTTPPADQAIVVWVSPGGEARIDALPAAGRLVFWVEGRRVAELDRWGVLRLDARMVEQRFDNSEASATAWIAYVPGIASQPPQVPAALAGQGYLLVRVWLGAAAAYCAALQLFADGAARVARVEEWGSVYPRVVPGHTWTAYVAPSGAFGAWGRDTLLSVDLVRAAMELVAEEDAAAPALKVRKIVENAW
jgi:hypothetical protein